MTRYPLIDGEFVTAEETAAFYEWAAANTEIPSLQPDRSRDTEPVPFDWATYDAFYGYAEAAKSVYDHTQGR